MPVTAKHQVPDRDGLELPVDESVADAEHAAQLERLDSFRSLQPGWDSYDASPLQSERCHPLPRGVLASCSLAPAGNTPTSNVLTTARFWPLLPKGRLSPQSGLSA
jgi:hypothetical protein